MALARVVEFAGVSSERLEEIQGRMGTEPPEGMPAKEFILLHDPEAEKAVAIVFFDTEDDYRAGDEILSAMPADETPGERLSVKKYDVPLRMSV